MAKWDHDDLRNLAADRTAEAVSDGARRLRAHADLGRGEACLEMASCAAAASNPFGRKRLIEADSAARKRFPMCSGLLDYFPDALAEVSGVSWAGNEKHNPGEPMHHARGKSMDHADCIMRHLTERGGFDVIVIGGAEVKIRHSAALAWRALALLQEELEREHGLPLPRAARLD